MEYVSKQENILVFTIKDYKFYRISLEKSASGYLYIVYAMIFKEQETILFVQVRIKRKKVKFEYFHNESFEGIPFLETKSLFEALYINLVFEPWLT